MVLVGALPAPTVVQSGNARGIAAATSAMFAGAWFGWGVGKADGALVVAFRVGLGSALVLAIAGVMLAVRSPAAQSPMADAALRRRYGAIVGLEFLLLGVGNVALSRSGMEEWIPVWVCFGVGVHFVPLSRLFGEKSLRLLAALLAAVAVVGIVFGLMSAVAPSVVTGAGAGLCLLGWSALALVRGELFAGPSRRDE
jgi:hypothetical protein